MWAPTIRLRNGVCHVMVTDVFGRGTVLLTATDPAGPWSDGLPIGIHGIDPDLAWDDDGTGYVTYSGLQVSGPQAGQHLGIQQARVDLASGELLEEPRSLWSGTGLIFPESPHLYRIANRWYLLIAEGGTERGHAISIARGSSPIGPFEGPRRQGPRHGRQGPDLRGRRQTRLDARIAARVIPLTEDTVGGITLRFDEQHHYDLEIQPGRAVGRAVLSTIRQEHAVEIPNGPVQLSFELHVVTTHDIVTTWMWQFGS